MALHVIKLAVFEDRRRHILVLDPIIGKYCRRQLTSKVHIVKPAIVFFGDLVVAIP